MRSLPSCLTYGEASQVALCLLGTITVRLAGALG